MVQSSCSRVVAMTEWLLQHVLKLLALLKAKNFTQTDKYYKTL